MRNWDSCMFPSLPCMAPGTILGGPNCIAYAKDLCTNLNITLTSMMLVFSVLDADAAFGIVQLISISVGSAN
jgi:hypothetical protein